jgi:phage tail sheath protein FI
MPTYLTPGVYIEEIPSSTRPIEAIGTSTAAFVGFARKGPIGTAELVTSWDEYVDRYGGVVAGSPPDLMGLSVSAYFGNGGSRAYVVRMAEGAQPAEGILLHPDAPDPANPTPQDELVRFEAVNGGAWGNALRMRLIPQPAGTGDRYRVVVQALRAPAPGLPEKFVEVESHAGLSLDPTDASYLESTLAPRSDLVRATVQSAAQWMHGFSEGEPLAPDFKATDVNGKKMGVAVDGTSRPVAFGASQFGASSDLDDIAAEIQKQVRGNVQSEAAVAQFTASATGGRLLLRSGAPAASSRVAVTPPAAAAEDATALLRIGSGRGRERTGAQALADRLGRVDPAGGVAVALDGGTPGTPVSKVEPFRTVFNAFLKIRDINTICLPDNPWAAPPAAGSPEALGRQVISEAIGHAERAQRRMVLVDPPSSDPLATDLAVSALELPTSPNAAAYHPWLRVANPAYDAETNPGADPTLLVPPCGFAAGMWGRIDGLRGVWKAPAGTEASLRGVAGFAHVIEDVDQEVLNPAGVNCLRTFPSYGPLCWGARTLATRAVPEWRYVPVRRTAMFIEGSVHGGIQWAVFEPNDERLWSMLRINVESFMDGLFRAGAFQGSKASDAYFVACGLGATMTQGDIDRGQVIVVIGFAPLKPAEFVIVRIQQQVGQQ